MTVKDAIIVVDDDHAVRDSLQSLLETAGFPVRLYGSAAAFLADCPASEQGCLLLDVQMPDMDGRTLQQKVRAGWPRLAVVVMTGHARAGASEGGTRKPGSATASSRTV
jgi:two-component system, LuxR family, response regulator FixJ